MDDRENYDGQAIYLNYPEFRGGAGGTVVVGGLDLGAGVAKILGIDPKKGLPVGHSAIITIDKDGNSRYTEYGRYTRKDGDLIGKVRGTVKGGNWRQKLLPKKREDEDLKTYMRRIYKSLPDADTGMTQATYIPTFNTTGALQYIDQQANDPDRKEYGPYHTCATDAYRIAGNFSKPASFKDHLTSFFKEATYGSDYPTSSYMWGILNPLAASHYGEILVGKHGFETEILKRNGGRLIPRRRKL